MRALALFSGGLDSGLAIKLLQEQGIEVIALNFVSHFFGGEDEKIKKMAEQLNVQVEYIDFKDVHTKIVENPPSGYGKNMNPCIDCHALMLRTAVGLFDKYDAKFLATGEILGQRPMSQNLSALKRVEKLSSVPGYVLRPLCAKLLEPTIPETEGWVDREKLTDIQGRSRKRQMEMADYYKLTEYPSPAGGCLLTDPVYSRRLRVLKDDGVFHEEYLFDAIKSGRFIRLDKGKYIIAGRHLADNENLETLKEYSSNHIEGDDLAGPLVLTFGDLSEEEIGFGKKVFARYSKNKGSEESPILINGEKEVVPEIDREEVDRDISERLIK